MTGHRFKINTTIWKIQNNVVSQSTNQSISEFFLFSFYCSHAKCTRCHQWKLSKDESWCLDQRANNRSKGTALICNSCTKKAKEQNMSSKDHNLYSCEACKGLKGRGAFSSHLMIQFIRKNLNYKVILICLACQDREKKLLTTLKSSKVRKCTKKCKQDWPHSENCQCYRLWEGYPLLSKDDLQWLYFRAKNRKYH